MKTIKLFITAIALSFFSGSLFAQIVGTDAFLMSDGIEVGIHNDGYEGSSTLPPFPNHYRGWTGRIGFLSNPAADGWTNYNGDYFMPGSPENRFGIEVDGVTYHNSSATGSMITSSGLSNYHTVGNCKFVDWDGSVAGIDIHMTYKMDITDYYYTVQVELTNTNAVDKNDVYFYKSLDPDNNQDIGWGYATLNTVEYQPTPECPKALVSAYDNNGWDSYIGLGGLGENMRVAYGGFFVDDASAVYDGTFPYVGTMGASLLTDAAIAICHKDDVIPAGSTTTFEFVVVMNAADVNQAILNLFHFTYDGGPVFAESCEDTTAYITYGGVVYETDGEIDTIWRCTEEPKTLWVEAPGIVVSDFNLAWVDDDNDTLGTEAYTVIIPGTEADTAHYICYVTLGACFGGGVGLANEYVVITLQSPEIYIPDPGTFCGDSVLLSEIEVLDTAYVVDPIIEYYSSIPDSIGDPSDIWTSEYIYDGDVVYVLMANPDADCYDIDSIIVEFTEVSAGDDATGDALCTTDGTLVSLEAYLSGADAGGVWVSVDPAAAGGLDELTGDFIPLGIPGGTYEFLYIVGEDPCEPDTAVITVDINVVLSAGNDNAYFACGAAGYVIDLHDLLDGNEASGEFSAAGITTGFDAAAGTVDLGELDPGVYVYYFTVNSLAPCASDVAIITITVGGGPTAFFSPSTGMVATDQPVVSFMNGSEDGAISYVWDFGDGSDFSTDENPQHQFPGVPGTYEVELKATDEFGCADSMSIDIKVEDVLLFFIPNTFTPDGNSYNDFFLPVFEAGFDPYNYHITIFNRYGEVVFESYDSTVGWDGTYGSKGMVDEGIYTWSVEFKEKNTDKMHQHRGHVTVLK